MSVTTIQINSLYEELMPLVESVARDGLPADSRLVYSGRNTVVAVHTDMGPINIKAFRVPHIINRVAYGLLRPSKAARSFNNAMRLLSLGIDTPEPVAYAETRTAGLFGKSYYFSRHEEGVCEVRDLARRPERDTMIAEIAALMARMHAAGILFKDFSPGNLLYRTDAAGRRRYMLVDINRMSFGVHERDRQMAMFERLIHDEDLTAQLARDYCTASGIAPGSPEGERLIADARASYRAFWRRRRERPNP